MFKTLRFSLKKSKILSKIRNEYKSDSSQTDFFGAAINELVIGKTMNKKELYFEELLGLLKTDPYTVNLLKEYNKKIDDLRKIVATLARSGAGQIVRGHYVPVSSIAFIGQLENILKYWDGNNFSINNMDSHNSNLLMAYNLLTSFK